MMKKYKWIGQSGYTPALGKVQQGQIIGAISEAEINTFLDQKLIEEVKTIKSKGTL